jgi:hypothetical protein
VTRWRPALLRPPRFNAQLGHYLGAIEDLVADVEQELEDSQLINADGVDQETLS